MKEKRSGINTQKFTVEKGYLVLLLIIFSSWSIQAQEFKNSVYANSNITGPKDISVFKSVHFEGWSYQEVYDRRIPEYTYTHVAVYKVKWNTGDSIEVQVLKELINLTSIESVLKNYVYPYAYKVGQLPQFLLEGIRRVVLFNGNEVASAALGSIYIHITYQENKDTDFIEEMLIHEGGHAALDEKIRDSAGWKSAQKKDSLFVSEYASENPDTEDLAESVLAWISARHRSDRISKRDSFRIVKTIPNRLAFLDSLDFNIYPLDQITENDYLYTFNREEEIDLGNYLTLDEFLCKIGKYITFILITFVGIFIFLRLKK